MSIAKKDPKLAVQDGLSTNKTYVILNQNARAGIHLAIRPHVRRVDNNTVWFGGRLRVAFNFDRRGHTIRPEKFKDASQADVLKLFKKEYPGLDFMTSFDGNRRSTTVGILIAAGIGDSNSFRKVWDEVDFVGALLDEIRAKTGKPMSGVRAAGGKDVMYDELVKRFEACFGSVFYGDKKVPKEVLGEISQMLNQGAKRGFTKQRDSFIKKVAKEVATATPA
jgi:hypothetical protein